MARYIDADKLFRYVDEQTHLSKGKLQNYIRENHTADVVEVVRCEKCKYHTSIGTCDCPQWLFDDVRIDVKPTDFCSYGERKEQG